MGREVVLDAQPSFGGGLNVTADPSQMQPNQVREATNVRLSEFGGAGKRLGTVRLTLAALGGGQAIQNGATWYRVTNSKIMVVQNGYLYASGFSSPSALFSFSTSTGNELTTENDLTLFSESTVTPFVSQGNGLATTGTPDFASFLYTAPADTECMYIADGGPLNRWDGTTLELNLASTPSVTQIAVYNQRLFGVTGTNQSVYYSELNDGDTLGVGASGGGEAIIRTFGDQVTTGLAVSGSSLMIFHRSGISRWTGFTQDDIAIAAGATGITSEVGTTNAFSIVEVSGQVYFLGPNGFYRVSEHTPPESISAPIDSIVRGWDGDTVAGVRGVHARNYHEIRWFVPDVGIMVYNYRLNAWSGPWDAGYLSPATTCHFESEDNEGRFLILRGDASGWVTLCDADGAYLDNLTVNYTGGTSFTMSVQPHRFFAGDPMNEKAYRWGYLLMDPRGTDTVSVEWVTQSGSGSYAIDATSLAVTNAAVFRVPLADRGEWIDLTIVDSGEADALYSRTEVQAFAMGRRGGT